MKIKRTIVIESEGLGDRIRKARKESGLTLKVLSDKAGITQPHWTRIEKEQINQLPEPTLRAIEFALQKRLV